MTRDTEKRRASGVDIERPEDWMAIDVVEDALPALFRAVDERDELRKRVAELRREVEFLRHYGNNDCTAMADEAIARATSSRS